MTLIEVMITVSLMGMVILGVLSANFFGLREDQLLESKGGMNDSSRRAISELLHDIRAAKGYDIGNISTSTNFSAFGNGTNMQGPALRLYTTILSTNQAINLTNYIVYYFDTSHAAASDGILYRMTSGSTPKVVVSNLVNTFTFSSEFYTGGVQNVKTYKGIVHTTLQFCQFQYPKATVGTNGLFSSYRIECRATPHLPDGP